jgi:hypothetical protein
MANTSSLNASILFVSSSVIARADAHWALRALL